ADGSGVDLPVDGQSFSGGVFQGVEHNIDRKIEDLGGVLGEGEHGQQGDHRAEVGNTVELGCGGDADPGTPSCGGPDQVSVVDGQMGDANGREDQLVAG